MREGWAEKNLSATWRASASLIEAACRLLNVAIAMAKVNSNRFIIRICKNVQRSNNGAKVVKTFQESPPSRGNSYLCPRLGHGDGSFVPFFKKMGQKNRPRVPIHERMISMTALMSAILTSPSPFTSATGSTAPDTITSMTALTSAMFTSPSIFTSPVNGCCSSGGILA